LVEVSNPVLGLPSLDGASGMVFERGFLSGLR
jgi:hypothetical protein